MSRRDRRAAARSPKAKPILLVYRHGRAELEGRAPGLGGALLEGFYRTSALEAYRKHREEEGADHEHQA